MSDMVEVAIVTGVAIVALVVLIRPLFNRDKPGPTKPAGGCDTCGVREDRPDRP